MALDQFEEGASFDSFQDNSGSAIDLDQVVGGGDGAANVVESASDLQFELGFGGWEASEKKFENAALFPGENFGGETCTDQFVREGDGGVQGDGIQRE